MFFKAFYLHIFCSLFKPNGVAKSTGSRDGDGDGENIYKAFGGRIGKTSRNFELCFFAFTETRLKLLLETFNGLFSSLFNLFPKKGIFIEMFWKCFLIKMLKLTWKFSGNWKTRKWWNRWLKDFLKMFIGKPHLFTFVTSTASFCLHKRVSSVSDTKMWQEISYRHASNTKDKHLNIKVLIKYLLTSIEQTAKMRRKEKWMKMLKFSSSDIQ